MPEDIKGPIREERDSRRLVNVYEAELAGWLNGDIGGVAPKYKEYGSPPVSTKKYREVVTWQEVAKDFLGIETPERWKDKALQMQIAQALKSLGWGHTRQAIDGVRTRCWVRGPEDSSEVPF